jgi:hypothetical protein
MPRTAPALVCVIASALALQGCPDTGAPPAPDSAWRVVDDALGRAFFEVATRGERFEPAALEQWKLPALLEPERYRFLGVLDLWRVDPDHRKARVAFEVDGWPMAASLEVRRDDGRWRIASVPTETHQRALLARVTDDVLPTAETATPWRGGLAGRDAAGRPTSAVLVWSDAHGLEVDGQATDAPPEAAIRDGIRAREEMARDSHSTYRPQAALAVPRRAPAQRALGLVRAARAAGAADVFLVVRGPAGRPALLALARPEPVPRAEAPPLLRVEPEDGAARVTTPGGSPRVIPLRRLPAELAQAMGTHGGVEIAVPLGESHQSLVELVAAAAARPGTPVRLLLPDTDAGDAPR